MSRPARWRRPRRSPPTLGAELQAEPQAYGKIIDGVIALSRGDAAAIGS